MGYIETSYYYISNDNLSVTIDPDDIPFPGVVSYSLDQPTTNLVDNALGNLGRGLTLSDLGTDNEGWRKYSISGTWSGGTYPYAFNIPAASFTGGSLYSAQTEIKFSDVSKWTNIGGINYVNATLSSPGVAGHELFHNEIYKFYHYNFAYQDSTTQVGYLVFRPNGSITFDASKDFIWIRHTQVENHSFKTAYTPKATPRTATGELYFPLDSFPVQLHNTSWVLSYWKKPFGTHSGMTGYNISSIGIWTSDSSKGYIWWGKQASTNNLALNVNNTSTTTPLPSDYWYNWHHEVLVNTGKELLYYVDGQKKITSSYSTIPPFDHGLYIGGWVTGATGCNALYADIYFGPYLSKSGSIIWTPDFIARVYELRKPIYAL